MAHEKLKKLDCIEQGQSLAISQTFLGYDVLWKNAGSSKSFQVSKIAINDKFDAKTKQIFDVYSAKTKDLMLEVKKPETKGKITAVTAQLTSRPNGKTVQFSNCTLKAEEKSH